MTHDASVELTAAIEKWWKGLTAHIKLVKEGGRQVVLIALSRKMPRLFEWMKDNASSLTALKQEDWSLIDSCVYTTEHAIPFVLKQKGDDEVVILDDVIHSGRTVRTVIQDVKGYVSSPLHVFAIFRNEDVSIQGADVWATPCGGDRLNEFAKEISGLIKATHLPVDMEYPIIKVHGLKGSRVEELISLAKEKLKYDLTYQISEKWVDRYALVLEDETKSSFNNDFAKLRFFVSENVTKIVPYAPNIFSATALVKEPLFLNEKYLELYRVALNEMTFEENFWLVWDSLYSNLEAENSLNRQLRTLTVWANYLFSLSAFIRFMNQLKLDITSGYELEYEDVRLILGDNLARRVLPKLNQLIHDGETSPSTRESLDIPSCLIPSKLKGSYMIQKYKVSLRSNGVGEALSRIFALIRFLEMKLGPLYNSSIEPNQSMMPEESYDSLIEALSIRFNKKEIDDNIYRWMDEMVDEGRIIPKYECVRSESGIHYWRRFFSISSFALGNLNDDTIQHDK
jgi:hypothetical protein